MYSLTDLLSLMNEKRLNLLKQLVLTEFKLRYQGSVIGHLWSLLKPLAMFSVLYVVFTQFLKIGNEVPHYPVFLLMGIVCWNFITESTNSGLNAIVARGDLLRKVNISKITIIMASSISALINLFINFGIIVVLMIILGVGFHSQVWLVALLIFELLALCLGIALILSAIFVRFRDIAPIWEIILQLMFYATPIIYPISTLATSVTLPETIKSILLLNPAAQIVQDMRAVLLPGSGAITPTSHFDGLLQFVPYILAFVPLLIGYFYFRRESKNFAENL